MEQSTPCHSTDAAVLIAHQLGGVLRRAEELDSAWLASKENDCGRSILYRLHMGQMERCYDLEKAICLVQAQTLEGAQAQLLIAASLAAEIGNDKNHYEDEIRAALASALSILAANTGKTAADLNLDSYSCHHPEGLASSRASSTPDPLVALCAEALVLKTAYENRPHPRDEDEDEAQGEAGWRQLCAIYGKIETTPAQGIAGLAAKLRVADNNDEILDAERIWRSAAADAERLAKGGAS